MTELETRGGNSILALYIGDIPDKNTRVSLVKRKHVYDLKYHLDWNELIKIAEYLQSDIDCNDIMMERIRDAVHDFNKERTWRALISHVKYVNKKKAKRTKTFQFT